VFDYWIVSSYGTYGPFSGNSSNFPSSCGNPIGIPCGGTGATTAAGANLSITGVTQTGTLGTSSQVSTFPGTVSAGTSVVSTLVSTVALIYNSTAAATANTAAIQGALNQATGGGQVYIPGAPGSLVYTNSTLVIYSGTTLRVAPGVSIIHPSEPGVNTLVNYAYTQIANATAVTLTTPTNTSLPVAWTAHGLNIGDYIYLFGGTPSAYVGVFRVISVTDANNIVVAMWRNAAGVSPSGSFTALKCDTKIHIEGGIWDYGAGNTAGSLPENALENHDMILVGLADSSATDIAVLNAPQYGILIAAARDFRLESPVLASPLANNVKVYGPSYNIQINNVSGTTGDDTVSLQTKELDIYLGYRVTYGDIMNVTVDNTDVDGSASHLSIYPSPNEYMGGIVLKNLGGSTPGQYPLQVSTGWVGSQLNDVTVDGITSSGTGIFQTVIFAAGDTLYISRMKFKNVVTNPQIYGSGAEPDFLIGVQPGGAPIIGQLEIDGWTRNLPSFPGIALSAIDIENKMNELDVRNVYDATGNSSTFILENAPVTTINVDHVYRSTSTGGFINIGASTTTLADQVNISNSTVGTSTVIATNSPVNVNFTDNNFTAATAGVLYVGASGITVNEWSKGNNIESGGLWYNAPSYTPTVNMHGWDFQVNLCTAPGTLTGAGNYVWDSCSNFPGNVGPAFANGTQWLRQPLPIYFTTFTTHAYATETVSAISGITTANHCLLTARNATAGYMLGSYTQSGSLTLTAGTGTTTVPSGSFAVVSSRTSTGNTYQGTVSGTTLTVTSSSGTDTGTVNYIATVPSYGSGVYLNVYAGAFDIYHPAVAGAIFDIMCF
jgi:hypothetical protein